jgi:hypothetical protein
VLSVDGEVHFAAFGIGHVVLVLCSS